jgi:hypothetical protein
VEGGREKGVGEKSKLIGSRSEKLQSTGTSSSFDKMSMVYQANASPHQYWQPLLSEPEISLTQHLAPEADAKCLLLAAAILEISFSPFSTMKMNV